jgi:hypothetical protein
MVTVNTKMIMKVGMTNPSPQNTVSASLWMKESRSFNRYPITQIKTANSKDVIYG